MKKTKPEFKEVFDDFKEDIKVIQSIADFIAYDLSQKSPKRYKQFLKFYRILVKVHSYFVWCSDGVMTMGHDINPPKADLIKSCEQFLDDFNLDEFTHRRLIKFLKKNIEIEYDK